jgi:spore germination protein YaaH
VKQTRKIFILAVSIALTSGIIAQDESILSKINKFYSLDDTSSNKSPDTVRFVVVDTLPSVDSSELDFLDEVFEVEPIDSNLFMGEVLFPEKQIPVKLHKREQDWKKEYLLTNQVTYKNKHILDTSFRVFGWHPYWMGNAYESYNFSLLSYIAYFSYELNPNTGGYNTIHNWKTTALIDSAHANNSKVLLTVTSFGKEKNKLFLNNIRAQKNLIRQLITLLKERNADGVNLDFEGVRPMERDELTNFIIDLSSSLKTENNNYVVTVSIPAFDFNQAYNVANIESHIDLFVIMGYEIHGVRSKTAGPISPLSSGNRWTPLNLERSVDEYLIAGVPPKKLLLGVPYYGIEWQTYDLKFPSKVKKFERYHTFRNIKKITKNYSSVIDEPSLSKYYAYRDQNNNYRQIWFDDSLTLGMKYDWVKEKDIGGIGIWALGYDNGHTELWHLIAKKFAFDDNQLASLRKKHRKLSVRRIMNLSFRMIRNPRSVLTRPRPIMMMFGSLFGLSLIGFMVMFRYGHRFSRLFGIALKGTVSIIIIISIALVFIMFKYLKVKEFYVLLIGIILGLFLFYLFSRRFLSEKDKP